MDLLFAPFARGAPVLEADMLEPSLAYVPLYSSSALLQCGLPTGDVDLQLDATLAVLFESDFAPHAVPLSTAIATVPLQFAPVSTTHQQHARAAHAAAAVPTLSNTSVMFAGERSPSPCPGPRSPGDSGSGTPPPPSSSVVRAPSKAARRRPKPLVTYTTKEPLERNFGTHEDFVAAWQRWRLLRDQNNAAVRRSRESKRKQRTDDDDGGECTTANTPAYTTGAPTPAAVTEAFDLAEGEAAAPTAAAAAPAPAAPEMVAAKCETAECSAQCDGCQSLVATLHKHRRHVALLVKALRSDAVFDESERAEYLALMSRHA